MTKLSFFFLLLCFFSCKSSLNESSDSAKINSQSVKDIVSYIASDQLKGRETGCEGINRAAIYIENKFQKSRIKLYFYTLRDHFLIDNNSQYTDDHNLIQPITALNIIGLEGHDKSLENQTIISSAHYDYPGEIHALEGESIANGANDHAFGVSAVVTLPKYFSSKKNNKCSLLFVLFSAEEKGLLGSLHLASRLREEEFFELFAMINFEMIGVPLKDKNDEVYLSGYELSNIADKINEYAITSFVGLLPKAKAFRLFKRSDNYPFYTVFKVVCHTLSSFDFINNPYYQHVNDQIDYLDFDFTVSLINKLIPAIRKIANSTEKEIYLYGK